MSWQIQTTSTEEHVPPAATYTPKYGQPAHPGYPQQGYGQPPQTGYPHQPPPPAPGSTTYVVSQAVTVVSPGVQFRDVPVRTVCPACKAEVITSVHFETGTLTWVVCLVLLFFGLWLSCCLIPFCIDGCKDAAHSCPNCRHLISRYRRTTVVVAAPPVFAVQIFREQPVRMKCPHCSSDIVTSITYETGTLTWPPPYYDPKAAPPPQGGYPQAQPYPQGGYPPPQPGMVPPGQTTVVVTGAPLPIFRDQPVRLKCGHCQADIVTSLTYESGALCWIICGVLLLFGRLSENSVDYKQRRKKKEKKSGCTKKSIHHLLIHNMAKKKTES
ncbi:hypothetical protein KUTeg_004575 [Tegillarca granosa]|uniref:LITAF domain-containing protein n=1 Tax=Tegillarca granosa TaxID=220873 RepID=A0ABQ9FQA4_TEGGR|nr:hypothetical protein KUTeg_004575 [Tegillarca granosa]